MSLRQKALLRNMRHHEEVSAGAILLSLLRKITVEGLKAAGQDLNADTTDGYGDVSFVDGVTGSTIVTPESHVANDVYSIGTVGHGRPPNSLK
jgi:hypothetical protein